MLWPGFTLSFSLCPLPSTNEKILLLWFWRSASVGWVLPKLLITCCVFIIQPIYVSGEVLFLQIFTQPCIALVLKIITKLTLKLHWLVFTSEAQSLSNSHQWQSIAKYFLSQFHQVFKSSNKWGQPVYSLCKSIWHRRQNINCSKGILWLWTGVTREDPWWTNSVMNWWEDLWWTDAIQPSRAETDASPREQQRARQSHSQQPDIVGPFVGPTTLLNRCISLS